VREHVRGKRVTITDIAARAGVSKGSVSYALNNRPGLSDATRRRILAIADELGWYPNSAARALSAARAGACGLVLARPARTLGVEPFFMDLIAGIESAFAARSVGLVLQVVDDLDAEIAVYRRWWAEHRVDGVLLIDPRVDDPRIDAVRDIGLPAVMVGGPDAKGRLPAVWSDDAAAMVSVVRYLATLGHRDLARVAGVPGFLHTEQRTQAFQRTCEELRLRPLVLTTDYSAETGAQVTRHLLSSPAPPTAVIYYSVVLAVAGLGVAHEMGLSPPEEVSIVAWDDSPFCRVVHPPLTALLRDISQFGATAAKQLLTLLEKGSAPDVETPNGRLAPRGSTGRPPPRTLPSAG